MDQLRSALSRSSTTVAPAAPHTGGKRRRGDGGEAAEKDRAKLAAVEAKLAVEAAHKQVKLALDALYKAPEKYHAPIQAALFEACLAATDGLSRAGDTDRDQIGMFGDLINRMGLNHEAIGASLAAAYTALGRAAPTQLVHNMATAAPHVQAAVEQVRAAVAAVQGQNLAEWLQTYDWNTAEGRANITYDLLPEAVNAVISVFVVVASGYLVVAGLRRTVAAVNREVEVVEAPAVDGGEVAPVGAEVAPVGEVAPVDEAVQRSALASMRELVARYHATKEFPADKQLEEAVLNNEPNTFVLGQVRKTIRLKWTNEQALFMTSDSPNNILIPEAATTDYREQFTAWVRPPIEGTMPSQRAAVFVLAHVKLNLDTPGNITQLQLTRKANAAPTPTRGGARSRGADGVFRGALAIRAMSLLAPDGDEQFARELDALLERWPEAARL